MRAAALRCTEQHGACSSEKSQPNMSHPANFMLLGSIQTNQFCFEESTRGFAVGFGEKEAVVGGLHRGHDEPFQDNKTLNC